MVPSWVACEGEASLFSHCNRVAAASACPAEPNGLLSGQMASNLPEGTPPLGMLMRGRPPLSIQWDDGHASLGVRRAAVGQGTGIARHVPHAVERGGMHVVIRVVVTVLRSGVPFGAQRWACQGLWHGLYAAGAIATGPFTAAAAMCHPRPGP